MSIFTQNTNITLQKCNAFIFQIEVNKCRSHGCAETGSFSFSTNPVINDKIIYLKDNMWQNSSD